MASILNATTTSGLVTSADNSGSLQLQTNNGTTAVTIDTSQNVGIGTSSPSAKLHVSGGQSYVTAAVGAGAYSRWYNNAQTTNDFQIGQGWTSGSDNVAVVNNNANAAMIFGTNGTERMRITSGGEVCVGTTNPSGTAGAGAKIVSTTGGFTYAQVTAETSNANATAYNYYSTGAGAYRFYVGAGGTVYATSTTITGISDVRLKENIQDIDVGLDALMALRPRKFDWKEGKGKDKKGDRGWIAQEFETVFPDMIDEWKDPAPEGEEPYKAVNADLIPVLVKAIQELKAELDTVKAELNTLKNPPVEGTE